MSRLTSVQAQIDTELPENGIESDSTDVSIREEVMSIPDDYLLTLWNETEQAKDKETLEANKEKLLLELCNVLSILNYCEENMLPYIVDRIKIFKQIDAVKRFPQDPFGQADKDVLYDIGYSIKPPCIRVFEHENKVLARSYTSICFHPYYGKYTYLINKIAYLPLHTKPKTKFKMPELDLEL